MVRTSCVHSCGLGFQSLVEELKSHKLSNAAKKKKRRTGREQPEWGMWRNRDAGKVAAYSQVTAVFIVLPQLVGPASCCFQRSLATKECEAKGQGR